MKIAFANAIDVINFVGVCEEIEEMQFLKHENQPLANLVASRILVSSPPEASPRKGILKSEQLGNLEEDKESCPRQEA